jgi:hypothetical protein
MACVVVRVLLPPAFTGAPDQDYGSTLRFVVAPFSSVCVVREGVPVYCPWVGVCAHGHCATAVSKTVVGFDEWKGRHALSSSDLAGAHSHSLAPGDMGSPLQSSLPGRRGGLGGSQQRRPVSPIHPASTDAEAAGADWGDLFGSGPSTGFHAPKASVLSSTGPTSNPFAASAMQRAESSLARSASAGGGGGGGIGGGGIGGGGGRLPKLPPGHKY